MGCAKKPYAAFPENCPYVPDINKKCAEKDCDFFEYTINQLFEENILVSILMPYYKASETLSKAVSSILEQTYTNWELIIVNDGDIDDAAIKDYINGLIREGFRIRYAKQNNHGQAHARNEAFKMSTGNVIAYLDADDEWLPKHLELGLLKILEGNTFIYSNFMYKQYTDAYTYGIRDFIYTDEAINSIHNMLRTHNPISLNTVLHTRSLFVVAGGFEPGVVCGEDGLLWRRMSNVGANFGFVEEPTAYYCRRERVGTKYHQSINLKMPDKGKGIHLIGGDSNGQELDIQKTYLKRVKQLKPYLHHAEPAIEYIDLPKEDKHCQI